MRRSFVEKCILTILDDKEMYGLQIIDALQQKSGGRLKLGFGTVYPALRRLERKDFVKTRWGDERPEERGGARRKYYKISAEGAKTLQEVQGPNSRQI